MKDNDFKKALNISNIGKLKLKYPVTIKNAQGLITKEVLEVEPLKPNKRGTFFNSEEY